MSVDLRSAPHRSALAAMLFFLRSLVYCELGLLFVLHATELQAQALKAVGKSYHESSSPSRLTSSLRDAGRPAVEEAGRYC